jgi:hypothetical protein
VLQHYPLFVDRHIYAATKGSINGKFTTTGLPVITIDTKKTELIGEFMNKGRRWRRQAEEVSEHYFAGAAKCRAVPFGIYDIARNEGHVYVGASNNTPASPFTPLLGGGRTSAIKAIQMQAHFSSWQIVEEEVKIWRGQDRAARRLPKVQLHDLSSCKGRSTVLKPGIADLRGSAPASPP